MSGGVKPPKVFLDLDRTTFDTERANRALWFTLATVHETLDPARCAAEASQFYEQPPHLSYRYNLTAHLRSYGLNPQQTYDFLAESELADGRFELPGTAELVWDLKTTKRARVQLLTYGCDEVQRFKVRLCPSLAGLPVITTLAEKQSILGREGQCWMIDDKDLGPKPPDNVHLVQVLPPGRTPRAGASWPVCSDLKQVKEYLDEHMY